jgi:DNA-binding transcriptional ArsR family regulator
MDEKELEKILKALANKRRILMLKILKKRKKISVGNMAKEIKLSFRSTSKHFSILYTVGILEKEQNGLIMYYSLASKSNKIIWYILSII